MVEIEKPNNSFFDFDQLQRKGISFLYDFNPKIIPITNTKVDTTNNSHPSTYDIFPKVSNNCSLYNEESKAYVIYKKNPKTPIGLITGAKDLIIYETITNIITFQYLTFQL